MIKNVNIVLKELKQNLINILLLLKKIRKIFKVVLFLTLFKMGIFGVAHVVGVGDGGAKRPPSLRPMTHPTMMKLGSYTLPKEDPKNTWITWHTPWVLLTPAFFQQILANFVISKKADMDCFLPHNFQFF